VKTEVEVQIEQLLRKGERWNIIAQTLHVSKTTILKVSRRLNEETSMISASEVFTKFDEGKSPMEIVKEFNANPVTIREWFNAWRYLNKAWEAYEGAKESMAEAREKAGEKAEKVEEEPRRDWKKILKSEPPPFLRES